MQDRDPSERSTAINAALEDYAIACAETAQPELYVPLTLLLSRVREALGMDVVFIGAFSDAERVFEVVSADSESNEIVPGGKDFALETYCHRVAQGRLPAVIADTAANEEVRSLPITERLGIRAYLSAPVVLRNGHIFGTVCCISHQPRADLVESDASSLRAVAEAVAASVDRHGKVRYGS